MDARSLAPSKIIAVHLNYRSRADERGRRPPHPSYFLKPPSSIGFDGDPVERPRGVELLNYEGEIAIVVRRCERHRTIEQAASAIAWVTAANDLGAYDMRWADRGSNVMAKGQDGFTPLGPRLIPASELDLDDLRIRTRVNGTTVQEGSTSELLFPFALLIADLSRFVTLEEGDVILTGTPAGSRPCAPGDEVEVEVDGVGVLRTPIVESAIEPLPYGASPKLDAKARQEATGASTTLEDVLSPEAQAALASVSTATLTVQLRKRGIANTFLGGLRPARPDRRLLGLAHTLRYVALREDVAAADRAPLNAQKATIERLQPGEVLVIEARGEGGAGTIGDILAARAIARGARGIVTDGGVRDSPAFADLEIPTYYRAPHAAVLGLLHHPLEDQVPVTCAGVLVLPGDVLVGDAEGVVVLPAQLAEEVAHDALEQERREAWALERVQQGDSIAGTYPIGPERQAEYEAWRLAHERSNP